MRHLIILSLIFLVLSTVINAQMHQGRHDEVKEKIAQLEKIKLIEILNMDEETTLRFFSRRAEHQKQMDKLHKTLREKIDYLDVLLKSDRMILEGDLKAAIDEVLNLRGEIERKKNEYINSLDDILTYDQIAMLIVFEEKFRQELKRLILRERKPNRQD